MLHMLLPGACLLAVAPTPQDNYKLSGPLIAPRSVAGDVEDAALSPDGRRVVYLARQDDHLVAELYSAALDGSSDTVKLNGPLVAGGAIDDYAISPDGRRVVYQADQERLDVHELLSVPIDGSSSPVRLNEPSEGHSFLRYKISPDGRWVVFFDGMDFHLRSVPIEGGRSRELSSLRPGGYVLEFRFSSDGERVVFTADPDGSSGLNLYSAPLHGGVSARGYARRQDSRAVRLNAPLSPGTDIFSFAVGPGGNVVYQVIGTFDLYSTPVDGHARAVRLNPRPVPGGHVTYTGYGISADGERVVYRADQETDEVYELYSVPIRGRANAVKLNASLAPGGDVAHPGFEISPDGSFVVYRADQEIDGVDELYAVQVDAGANPVGLSAAPALPGLLETFRISPDGARVVYLAARDCGDLGLFSVPVERSSAPVQLNGNSEILCGGEGEDLNELEFQISPDGSRVVYLADEDVDGVLVRELYGVPIDGGVSVVAHARSVPRSRVRLNAPLPLGGGIGDPDDPEDRFSFAICPDGAGVVYRAGQVSASVLELFRVPIDGGRCRRLNPRLALGPPPGDVVDALVSADGARVVFRADRETDEVFELSSVSIAGDTHAVKLDGVLSNSDSVGAYGIVPESGRVVCLVRRESAVELHSTPIDGSAEPIVLNDPLVAGGSVASFQISPTGLRIAYFADQDTDEVTELYSVPTDGSAGPVKLNAALAPGGSVLVCPSEAHPHSHFTPDGSRVLYLADQDTDQVFELYSVAADGSEIPVKLNAPLVAGGDVAAFAACFQIGAGGRVVYLADQDTNGVFELFSALSGGGSSPIKLNPELVPGGDVSVGVDGVHLSPLGDRVVYRADQTVDEAYELFSVPIDGGAAPVRLNGPLIAAGDVSPLPPRISGDGARVVYRADQEHDGRFDLYSAPLDGTRPAVRLSALPFHSRHVEEFEIAPGGKLVVYRADQDTDQVFELYVVPIDGGTPALRLLAPDSPVESFRITPHDEQLVFAASRDSQGVDLYTVSILSAGSPVRLSGPMAGAGVRSFLIVPDGRRVLYIADQDTPEVGELFASTLPHLRVRRDG